MTKIESILRPDEILPRQIDTVGVGLYRVVGEDRVTDEWEGCYGHVVLVLMARIRDDDGNELPHGVMNAYVRPDGKRVILQWQRRSDVFGLPAGASA